LEDHGADSGPSSAGRRTRIDVIVAVRNEEEAIPAFLDRVMALRLPSDVDLRVVFVEDSSTDGTLPLLRRLARERPKVGYYSLVEGFGQGLAVSFALSRSKADAMIMMDVDGSHPIAVIPEMIAAFREGARVVQCVRRSLGDRKRHRQLAALAYHVAARFLTGIDPGEQNIFYRLVSAEFARGLLTQPRHLRYLRFPLPRQPGALRTILVDTPERSHGASKYPPLRLANLAVDAILSQIPAWRLSIWMAVGVAGAALAFLAGQRALAAAIAVGLVWLLARHQQLRRGGVLARIRVRECANVAA
jgi:glycosyltransferase involved in cell wall biosynthesis